MYGWIASQLDIVVYSLLKVALDFGVKKLLVSRSDEDVLKVDFGFFDFGNVLFVFGTVGGDDMGANFFFTF